MLKKESTILVIAIISGIAAFILGSQLIKSAASSTPKICFVIAQSTLKAGAVIEKKDLAFSKPAENKQPTLYYMQFQDVEGKVVIKDILAGLPILREDVEEAKPLLEAPVKEEEEAALVIPYGMKTLTLAADMLNSLPMELTKENYVDVIGYMPVYEGSSEKILQTIVRASQVIAIEKEAGNIKSVTLALTSDAVLAITRAMSQGKLSLVGRAGGLQDDEQTIITGVTEIIRGVEREKKTVKAPSE